MPMGGLGVGLVRWGGDVGGRSHEMGGRGKVLVRVLLETPVSLVLGVWCDELGRFFSR